jgi:hypothetical protein
MTEPKYLLAKHDLDTQPPARTSLVLQEAFEAQFHRRFRVGSMRLQRQNCAALTDLNMEDRYRSDSRFREAAANSQK